MGKLYHLIGVMSGGSRHILGVYNSPDRAAGAVHCSSYKWKKYQKLILVHMEMHFSELKEELIDCWEQQFVSTYTSPKDTPPVAESIPEDKIMLDDVV